MKRLFCVLLIALAAWAQESQPIKPQVQKVIQLKYVNADAMRGLLTIFNARTQSVNELRALAISGSAETIAAMEEVIQKFDVPAQKLIPAKKSVELTLHVIAASKTGTGQAIPGMDAVVRNMQSTFGYTAFELIDVLQLRVLDESVGEASSKATFRNSLGPLTFNVRVAPVRILQGVLPPVVQLGNMRFQTRWPVRSKVTAKDGAEQDFISYNDDAISTSVELREGQKVVVGKANLAGPDYTVFLVVSAKVVD